MSFDTLASRVSVFVREQPLTAFWFATAGVICILILIAILCSKFPPLQDYWEWLYQSAILSEIWRGDETGSFVLRDYPVPNVITQVFTAVLMTVLPPLWAGKITLLGYAALVAYLFRSVLAVSDMRTSAPAFVVLLSLLFGSQYYNGYTNNFIGNVLLLSYFVILVRRTPKLWETAFFSVIIFFSHATSFAVFGMCVTIFALWKRQILHAAVLIPTGLMFLWYAAAKESFATAGPGLSGIVDWFQYRVYTVAKFGPYHNFFLDGVGDASRAPIVYGIGTAANLLFAASLVFLGWRVALKSKDTLDPAFATAAVLVVAYPFMPLMVSGVVNVGERFLTIGILMLVILGVQRKAVLPLTVSATLCLFYVLTAGSFATMSFRTDPHTFSEQATSDVSSENRLRRLFWHRPYQAADRLNDIELIRVEGLHDAPQLKFETSLLGAAPKSRSLPTDNNHSR